MVARKTSAGGVGSVHGGSPDYSAGQSRPDLISVSPEKLAFFALTCARRFA
jgi:hypothetical protein